MGILNDIGDAIKSTLSNSWVGLFILIVLLVAGWKLTGRLANCLLIVALFIAATFVLFSPYLPQQLVPRILITTAVVALVALVIYYYLWTFPPLKPLISAQGFYTADQPPGYEVAGIKWQPGYSELRLNIVNTNNQDCTMKVRLKAHGVLVAKIGCREHTGNSQVSFEHVPTMSVGAGLRGHDLQVIGTELGYTMYCTGLPAHGHVSTVLALATEPLKSAGPDHPYTGFDDPGFWAGYTIENEGIIYFGNDPAADIYNHRPLVQPCITAEGEITVDGQTRKFSEKICQ